MTTSPQTLPTVTFNKVFNPKKNRVIAQLTHVQVPEPKHLTPFAKSDRVPLSELQPLAMYMAFGEIYVKLTKRTAVNMLGMSPIKIKGTTLVTPVDSVIAYSAISVVDDLPVEDSVFKGTKAKKAVKSEKAAKKGGDRKDAKKSLAKAKKELVAAKKIEKEALAAEQQMAADSADVMQA